MPKPAFAEVVQFLQRACALQGSCNLTDHELLERFISHRDEGAFTFLVRRHGPMILDVGRRVLGDRHEAEDVFQATFLILAQRNRSIGGNKSIGGWLHGVAQHVALKARTRKAKRRAWEWNAGNMPKPKPVDDLTMQELRSVLDVAIGTLPEKYREPIVLCYLEGKSHSQAAEELGWPKNTVTNRLTRGCELLRRKLEKRGISLAAGALATALTEMAAAAPLPVALTINTVKIASLAATGKVAAGGCLSAHVLALAEAATRGTAWLKAKVMLVAVGLGLAAGGGGWASYQVFAESSQPTRIAMAQAPAGIDQEKVPEKSDQPVGRDQYGDMLPPAALARLGTVKFRHEGQTANLMFSPNGKILVKRSDFEAITWDVATGKELYRFKGLPDHHWGTPLDISPDSTELAFINLRLGLKAKVSFLELQSGRPLRSLELPGSLSEEAASHENLFLRYIPGEKKLVYADSEGKVYLVNTASGQVSPVTYRPQPMNVASNGKGSKTSGKFSEWFDEVLGKRTIRGQPTSEIRSLSVSQDGQLMALGVPDGPALVSISTGKPRLSLPAQTKWAPFAITFSADRSLLAFDDGDWIIVADLKTGKELTRFNGNTNSFQMGGYIRSLAFLPDGKSLVSGNGDGKIRIWDWATGKNQKILDGRMSIGDAMAVSPDGKTVAYGGAAAIVRFWDLPTGKELFTEFRGHEDQVDFLAFARDGTRLFSGSPDHEIRVWNTATWQQTQILPGNHVLFSRARGQEFSISPDGKRVATIPSSKTVRITEIASGEKSLAIDISDTGEVASTKFSPDGQKLFTVDNKHDGRGYHIFGPYLLRHWDAVTGQQEHIWKLPLPVHLVPGGGLLLAPDGKHVFLGEKGVIHYYDVDSGKERLLRGRQSDWFTALKLSDDGRVLASGTLGGSRSVSLWEVATGKEVLSLQGHERSVNALAWSADCLFLASGDTHHYSGDSTATPCVRLWDVATGKELARFSGFRSDVGSVCFSPDGKTLVAGLRDSTVLVWDIAKPVRESGLDSKELQPNELQAHWAALANDDARQAHQAIWAMVAMPQHSVGFLKTHLRAVPAVDPAKYEQLISELNSEQFSARESAMKYLQTAGEHFKPLMEKTMKEKHFAETHRRLEQILNAITNTMSVPEPSKLRAARAIMALERIGSPEAKSVLETLAKGAPGARETEEARASLERLNARAEPRPQ